jgi:hypothetical protein
MEETPAYATVSTKPPTTVVAGTSGLSLAARAFGFTIVWTVCFYVLLNYMPTWTQKYMKLTAAQALWSNTIGLLVLMAAIPVMGRLSDRYGRKPLLLACCVAFIVLPYPLFTYLNPDAVCADDFDVLGRRPGGDRRDLPDTQPLDLDDVGLRAGGRHLRRLRALHLGLAHRPLRLADRAHLLPDRRRSRIDGGDLGPQGDGFRGSRMSQQC